MKSLFSYNFERPVAQNQVTVEDVCNCALEGSNDDGEFYYIVVKTMLGVSTIFTCGPVIPDVHHLPNKYNCTLQRIDCEDDEIEEIIQKWIRDGKKRLTSAVCISSDEAASQFRDLGDYLKHYGEDDEY